MTYFGLWFQIFQPMISWFHFFRSVARQKYHIKKECQRKAAHFIAIMRRRVVTGRCLCQIYLSKVHPQYPTTSNYAPPPTVPLSSNSPFKFWAHWWIKPLIMLESSWFNCPWKCPDRYTKRCALLISYVSQSNHHGNVDLPSQFHPCQCDTKTQLLKPCLTSK
jgi:hypothetical protein